MLDLGLPDNHRNRRLSASYIVDPIVFAKRTQALGDRFIEGLDAHLNGVFDSPQVATGRAGADAHGELG